MGLRDSRTGFASASQWPAAPFRRVPYPSTACCSAGWPRTSPRWRRRGIAAVVSAADWRSRSLAAAAAGAGVVEAARFARARAWLLRTWGRVGAHLHESLEFRRMGPGEGSCGIFLRGPAAVQEGTLLVRIPPAAVLRASAPSGAEDGELAEEAAAIALARQLWVEKSMGSSSQWVSYVDLLPQAFPTMPLAWPDALRQKLLRSGTILDATRFRESLLKLEARQAGLQDIAGLIWALCAVSSRSFCGGSLVPFIDSCNHSFEPTGVVRKFKHTGFQLVATRDILPGEELTYDYGSKEALGNDKLFFGYGFVPLDNQFHAAEVSVTASLLNAACATVCNSSRACTFMNSASHSDAPCGAELAGSHRIWRDGIDVQLWHKIASAVRSADFQRLPNASASFAILANLLHIAASALPRFSCTDCGVREDEFLAVGMANRWYEEDRATILDAAALARSGGPLQLVDFVRRGGRRLGAWHHEPLVAPNPVWGQ